MTLRPVKIRVDGVDVGEAVLDVDLDLPEGCELVYEATSLIAVAGAQTVELTCDLDADQWARLTEHSVFSDEPGEL